MLCNNVSTINTFQHGCRFLEFGHIWKMKRSAPYTSDHLGTIQTVLRKCCNGAGSFHFSVESCGHAHACQLCTCCAMSPPNRESQHPPSSGKFGREFSSALRVSRGRPKPLRSAQRESRRRRTKGSVVGGEWCQNAAPLT